MDAVSWAERSAYVVPITRWAVIVRMVRSDLAVLKLEPRHQALKRGEEIVDPGDRDLFVTAAALVRPDRHVWNGERHERVERNLDAVGRRRRRRPLHARRSYVVRVELSRNQGGVRVVEIRQRVDRIGVVTGITAVRVEYLDPAIPLHFVDEIALHRSAIGGGLRFRPLELHVVVRREDGGESSGGARRPSARGFQRVDDRRPGGVAPEDTAHGNDIENVGLAPLEIRVEIGQRPGFPEFLGHLIARQLAIDLEVREGSAIRRGSRCRPLEQCVIVRRPHRGEVSRRRRSLNVYLSAYRRNVHRRRSGRLGGPDGAQRTNVEDIAPPRRRFRYRMEIRQRKRLFELIELAVQCFQKDLVARDRRPIG